MDFGNLRLISALKGKLDWHGQRQKVLTQNVANADTPGYQAKDLKDLDFRDVLRRSSTGKVSMSLSDDQHIETQQSKDPYRSQERDEVFELKPTGNSITLEDEMFKQSQNADSYNAGLRMYRKYTDMFRLVVRSGG